MKNAVVLLSGGLDSYTSAAIAKSEGFCIYALSFYYHQRHSVEIERSKKIALSLGVEKHYIINLEIFKLIGKSALTDDIAVPQNRPDHMIATNIPVTYVPARNTVFLSHAVALAEVVEAKDIFIGVNALDYSGYPDCRPEYISAFEKAAVLGTKSGVEGSKINIQAPLINMSKSQIIQKGIELGCDYSLSISCYQPSPDGKSCGVCDSCLIRKKGFIDASAKDLIEYL